MGTPLITPDKATVEFLLSNGAARACIQMYRQMDILPLELWL